MYETNTFYHFQKRHLKSHCKSCKYLVESTYAEVVVLKWLRRGRSRQHTLTNTVIRYTTGIDFDAEDVQSKTSSSGTLSWLYEVCECRY